MTAPTSHVDDLVAAYALDAIDDDERQEVELHLRDCDSCRAELQEFAEAAIHLSDGYERQPPAALWASVQGAVANQSVSSEPPEKSAQPRGFQSAWGLAAAGLLVLGGWGIWQSVGDDLSPTQEVIQAQDAERFRTEYESTPITVVASTSLDRAVLLTEALPDLPDGEVYQGWWINDDGVVTSAGVLEGVAGAAEAETSLEGDPAAESAFAVSVEPAGGSQRPSEEPIVVLPLQS